MPDSPGKPVICAVVLAAGFSKRFQGNKLLSVIFGKKVLEWTIESAIGSLVQDVAVVIPGDQSLDHVIPAGVHSIINQWRDGGLGTSISAGVKFFRNKADAILFMAADQPLVDSHVLDALIRLYWDNRKSIVSCAVNGEIRNPMIFPSVFYDDLEGMKGDVGARTIALKNGDSVISVEVDPDKLIDVDSSDDLNAAAILMKKRFLTI